MLGLSNIVMILRWHKGKGLTFQFPWLRLELGLRLGWIFRCDGMNEIFSPLVVCDLEGSIVLVCPYVKLLDLSVL
jgi:hypothetical protein